MFKEPNVKVPYHFPGITVLIPRQNENDIVAIDKGILNPDKIPMETEYFSVIRLIGNIVLVPKGEYDPGKINPIKTFDPPVEFRVGYNFYDVMKGHGDLQRLKLACWDGDQWVILSDPSYEYNILPPSTGQVAEFKISSWVGDPPIAWGR